MPEIDDDLDDYYDYQNQTSNGVQRVESGLKKLLTPNIKFEIDEDESDYIEVPENTFSLK